MNWPVKAACFSVIALAVTLASCEAPKEIGLPPEVIAEVQFTDTLTVRTSTVLMDSVRTSNTQQLLVGRYRDPIFGRVSGQPFFEMGRILNLNADGSTNTYVVDSLNLDVAYSYLYGDTLQPFEIGLHRLTDTLRTGKTYYNNSSIPYEASPLATVKFNPAPSTNNTFQFKLSKTLGQQILDLSGKTEVSTALKFAQMLKGFTLVPSAGNGMMMGFSPGTSGISLNLYYHITNDTIAYIFQVPILKRFNQMQADRQGTALSSIQPLKPLSAAQTGGLNYVQDALGVVTKVEFPYLSKLFGDGRVAINRAELNIVPNQPQHVGGLFGLPSALTMAETDETNRLLRSKGDTELLLPVDGATFQSYVLPQIVPYTSKFRNYNFVLTTYLQAVSIGFKKSTGLLLLPASQGPTLQTYVTNNQALTSFYPFLGNKVDRLTINPTKENVKLRIFYTLIK
ncbi:DUF4270 family protein [Runella sp.]|uniref:DUF4270 family protein n=1 Tax=Runella sp. TaxID=1960881 RepID=UPI003D0DBEA8